MTFEELNQRNTQMIQSHGRAVIGVFDSGFSYTIGNTLKGVPELIMIGGIDVRHMALILNYVSDHLIEKGVPDDGIVDIGGQFPMKVIKASHRAQDEFMFQASRYHGTEDYDVLQVIVPDKTGKYQGDEGFDRYYETVLLSVN